MYQRGSVHHYGVVPKQATSRLVVEVFVLFQLASVNCEPTVLADNGLSTLPYQRLSTNEIVFCATGPQIAPFPTGFSNFCLQNFFPSHLNTTKVGKHRIYVDFINLIFHITYP